MLRRGSTRQQGVPPPVSLILGRLHRRVVRVNSAVFKGTAATAINRSTPLAAVTAQFRPFLCTFGRAWVFQARRVTVPLGRQFLLINWLFVNRMGVMILRNDFEVRQRFVGSHRRPFSQNSIRRHTQPRPRAIRYHVHTLFRFRELFKQFNRAMLRHPIAIRNIPMAVGLCKIKRA